MFSVFPFLLGTQISSVLLPVLSYGEEAAVHASDHIKKLAAMSYYQSWAENFAAIIAIDYSFRESCIFTQCLMNNTKFLGK